jgi:hypothetical protein
MYTPITAYQSNTDDAVKVHAAKIDTINHLSRGEGAYVKPEGEEGGFSVGGASIKAHWPKAGWYYIVKDGVESFMEPEEFEKEFTLSNG